ncbi:MAG: RsmE family RNA methyltransferase, partial [Parvularculaceae bacterium]|nr:RsmE family RNA methyltransferase [Parvularculaceae bacterium]
MIRRLHHDDPLSEDAPATLTAAQSHYLAHVLRLKPGDAFRVFNARDGEFEAALGAGKKSAEATVGRRLRAPFVAQGPDLVLVFAAVKRAAVETIVQKGTELGVARFIPVFTERTQRERVNLERLAAIAVEAAEQCLRLDIPTIAPATPLPTVLGDW